MKENYEDVMYGRPHWGAAGEDGVGEDEELSGAGDGGDGMGFAAFDEALVERLERRVPAEGGGQGGGVERAAEPGSPAAMWAWPAQRPLCWTNGATSAEQQARFDTFRSDFNANRPHEALGQVPPIRRYEPSPRPFPDRIEEPWYDPDHAVRRVRPTGEIKWGGSAALPRRGRGEAKPSQNKPGRLSTMSPVHSVNYVSGR